MMKTPIRFLHRAVLCALPLVGVSHAEPEIYRQPAGGAVTTGGSHILSVGATGATSYQWVKDGADIPDATGPQHILESALLADTGVYSVRVSDGTTTIPSERVPVTVTSRIDWEETFDSQPSTTGWQFHHYASTGSYSWDAALRSIQIVNDTPNDSALWCRIEGLAPSSTYRLHGWVKGESVTNGGANICQWNTWDHDSAPSGTFDWVKLKLAVRSDATGAVEIACRLGYWSNTVTGAATFTNLVLEKLPDFGSPDVPTVRCAYVIPADREPQESAAGDLARILKQWRAWFADEMERNGFGPKTIRLETDDSGTPIVHIIHVEETAAELRGSNAGEQFGLVENAAKTEGAPIGEPGQIWFIVPETHEQQPDGPTLGGGFLGLGGGSANDPGVAVLDSTCLARMANGLLLDFRTYAGMEWEQIGPYPLVYGVTFPWFEGTTVASTSSSAQGGALHELGHTFGLNHDFRNDTNFAGNVMGNGFRGLAGNYYPTAHPGYHARLSHAAAEALNLSRYFNAERTYDDNVRPSLALSTPVPAVSSGLARVPFTASDAGGLALAILYDGGDVIGEMNLSGTSVATEFRTPFFTRGATNSFNVAVYDESGNKSSAGIQITILSTVKRAPRSFVRITPESAAVGETVVFDASDRSNPSLGTIQYQWDFDGDGTYDTQLSAANPVTASFPEAGLRLVRVRAVAPDGCAAVSTPMDLRIYQPALDLEVESGLARLSWPVWMEGFRLETCDSLAADWTRPEGCFVHDMSNMGWFPTDGRPRGFFRLARP